MATLMLAEAERRSLKVEKPGGEDMQRFRASVSARPQLPYAVLNRGKSILTLDLKSPEATATLQPLIERADVVVEQFRPGVMERLGLGYEAHEGDQPAPRLLLHHRLWPRRGRARRRPGTISITRH